MIWTVMAQVLLAL